MPTDNRDYYDYSSRARARAREERRRKRRRAGIIRTIVILVILAIIAALVIFLAKKIKKDSLKDPYDPNTGYARIFDTGIASEQLNLFASDLCVLTDNITGETESGCTSGAALLCKREGGYSDFAKEALTALDPASTTKVMTCLLALKYGNLDDKVTLSGDVEIDEPGASLAGVHPGDVLTLEQLLYGLMLPSGNDAANAIAVHIGGSLQAFNDMMNEEAKRLGAVDTNFCNANGITAEEHKSTAYDLYLILNEALKYPKFGEIARTKTYTANFLNFSGDATSRSWNNSNGYVSEKHELREGIEVLAGKTGTTVAAGNCLVMAEKNENGEEYISIILKAQGKDSLYENMDFLLEKIN